MATKVSSSGKFLLIVVALLFGLSSPALAKKKKGHKKAKPAAAKKVGGSSKAAPEPPEAEDEAEEAEAPPPKEEDTPLPRPKPKMVEGDGDSEGAPSKRGSAVVSKKRSEEESASSDGPLALQFGVGAAALFRNTTWVGNTGMALAPYKLSPGPQAALWLEAYPAAFAGSGFASNIGLIGRLDYGFGVSSKTPAGAVLATKFQNFQIGLKVRFPLGTFVPYVSASYGAQSFRVEGMANIPIFEYKMILPAAGTRIILSPEMDIDISLAYLLVTDTGPVKTERPNTVANGVDVTASFGYRVMDMIGLRAGVDFRQYGIAFGAPAAGVPPVTGGTDRYIAVFAGAEVLFGGGGGASSSSSSSDGEEEEKAKGDDDEDAAPKKKAKPAKKKPEPDDEEEE